MKPNAALESKVQIWLRGVIRVYGPEAIATAAGVSVRTLYNHNLVPRGHAGSKKARKAGPSVPSASLDTEKIELSAMMDQIKSDHAEIQKEFAAQRKGLNEVWGVIFELRDKVGASETKSENDEDA